VKGAASAGLDGTKITTTTTGAVVVNGVITGTSCTWGSGGTCKSGDAVSVSVAYPFGKPRSAAPATPWNVVINFPSTFNINSTVIHDPRVAGCSRDSLIVQSARGTRDAASVDTQADENTGR